MRRAFLLFATLFVLPAVPHAGSIPRFIAEPELTRFPGGGFEWTARIGCVSPHHMQDARLLFLHDRNLDGLPDVADTLALPSGDCRDGELAFRRIALPQFPALVRVELKGGEGETGGTHAFLASEGGSLLSIHRYCARPRDGEPEWIEILNVSPVPVSLQHVRVQGRALAASGWLDPGESLTAGRDTVPLRLWRPGGRLHGTGTWSNLRNAGDTLRLSLTGGPMLDSLVYGGGSFPREACASLDAGDGGGTGGAAFGYALEPSALRWRSGAQPLAIRVRAPASGRYELRAYDIDGLELCTLARNAEGPVDHAFPAPGCAALRRHTGHVILVLRPRGAPSLRAVIRITE
jgi:hypothetical protein